MIEKHRKILFFGLLGIAVLMLFGYVVLTPYMSDDYAYLIEVREATSLWDLIKQQYGEYLSNSGRIIGQFNIRLSLSVDKMVFNVVNSLMFGALVLLMYQNIKRKKKYDLFILLLIVGFLWKYAVSFGQTMLWICGACNYLWGCVFILGFFTFYRHLLTKAEQIKKQIPVAVGTFFFGLLAGWCNENTSGGGFLLVLMVALNFILDRKKEGKRYVYPFMITGMAGMCLGMFGMVMAPGVRSRSAVMSEGEYAGLTGILSRFYKTALNVRELFWELLVMLVIVLVLMVMYRKWQSFRDFRNHESILYLIAATATSFVLVIAPVPADRAHFGAGIFLMMAVIQGIADVADEERVLKAVKYSLVSILCLWLCFTYLENLVNLARIYREENERIEMIRADKADPNGDGIVIVPLLRPEFENRFSNAHESDLGADKEYWINHFYEMYYDVGNITAIPRDEWEEKYADTFGQPK